MPLEFTPLAAVVIAALVFAYTNGFHDAATSLATSISTRALTPRVAVVMAAAMNMVGAFLGEGVARTIGESLIAPPSGTEGLAVLFAALVGAVVWNIITWYKRMPSSSSHALVGGLLGAALASASGIEWAGVGTRFAAPMVLSPLVGLAGGYLVMLAITWAFRNANPHRVRRKFMIAQSASSAAMALGHGLQDAQKTMGVVLLALITTGHQYDYDVPTWVVASAAVAMALGTLTGGWRIMHTLGYRVVHLDPPTGFAAESTMAAVSYATSFAWQVPISSTHTVTSAIIGAGTTRRVSVVRWGVAARIVTVWLLTLPAAAVLAALAYGLVLLVG